MTTKGGVPSPMVEISWVPWRVPVETRLPLRVRLPSLSIDNSSVEPFLIEINLAPAVVRELVVRVKPTAEEESETVEVKLPVVVVKLVRVVVVRVEEPVMERVPEPVVWRLPVVEIEMLEAKSDPVIVPSAISEERMELAKESLL